jgi:hypothetical protein
MDGGSGVEDVWKDQGQCGSVRTLAFFLSGPFRNVRRHEGLTRRKVPYGLPYAGECRILQGGGRCYAAKGPNGSSR